MLARAGHRDLLLAYPSVDRRAISELASLAAEEPGAAPVLLVDDAVQLDLIEGAVGRGPTPIEVAIDVDVGYQAMRGALQIGPKRSPIRTPEAARKLADGDRRAPRPQPRRADGLRGPDRRRRRRDPRAGAEQRRDPADAARLDRRDPRAARGDRRRGQRGRAAAVRQRRRHRQPRLHGVGGRGHRARRRIGLLRAGPLRLLQPLLARSRRPASCCRSCAVQPPAA